MRRPDSRGRLDNPPLTNGFTLKDKIVIVTGATNGIGLDAARALARQGATTHIVGRSATKLDESVSAIKAFAGHERVFAWQADLSSQQQIRVLAADLRVSIPRIDVLLNNAGAIFSTRQESPDGIELTWALNHLGYFLLTSLLLDAVKAAPAGRIVNVSSVAHLRGRINFADVELQSGYSGFKAYSQSKLANVMFTYALARRLTGSRVTTNAVHPGVVATGFGRNGNGVMNLVIGTLSTWFGRTSEMGATTSTYLASSPEVDGVTGQYFADRKAVKSSAASHDEAAQERLWALSETQVGMGTIAPPGDSA